MKTQTKALNVLSKNLDLDLFYAISIYPSYVTLQGSINDASKKEVERFCKISLREEYLCGEFNFEDILFEVVLTN